MPDLSVGSALLLLAAVVCWALAFARSGETYPGEPGRSNNGATAGRSTRVSSSLFWQGCMLAALAALATWASLSRGDAGAATTTAAAANLPGHLSAGWHAINSGWLLGFGVFSWAGIQCLLRLARRRWLWVDVLLPTQAVLILGLALWLGPQHLASLLLVCGLWFAALWVAACAVLLQGRAQAARTWPLVLLLAALGIGFAALAGLAWPPHWAQKHALLAAAMAWGLPFVTALLAIGVAVARNPGGRTEQEANTTLIEQRVLEATADLEVSFRQLADQKVQQVTERERKRIAADLHDDLGAKLLTIVHTSESERISSLAREALEEMRLSVRGLTGRPVQLADAMGDWRAETVSRLAQAGIDSDWHAPDELPQVLSSRAYVQTTRILRESTSNIIKHSGAKHCSVRVGIEAGDFQLVIQDDGNGITEEVDARLDRGHGLASMKNRAKQLQGQCLIESGVGYGTVIRLTLPLDTALGAA